VGSDGGRGVVRWRWPSAVGADWKFVAGPWQARDKVAFAPAVLTLGEAKRRLLVADAAGNVWSFDADRTGEHEKRWRGAADGKVPPGRPTGGFVVLVVEGGPRIVYGVDNRHLVCLSPADDAPAWVVRRKDTDDALLGFSPAGPAVLVTEQCGAVTTYSGKDGTLLGATKPALPDLFPQATAVAFGSGKVLMPLWDGSAVFLSGTVQ
jgi:hypothetical protein